MAEKRVICAQCHQGRHGNKGAPEYGDLDYCPDERGGFSWYEMDCLYPQWRTDTDVLKKLRARVNELESALDRADCTQREGGDVRHCGDARCWRCRAEVAERRVAELEAKLAMAIAVGDETADLRKAAESRASSAEMERDNAIEAYAVLLSRTAQDGTLDAAEMKHRASAAEQKCIDLERELVYRRDDQRMAGLAEFAAEISKTAADAYERRAKQLEDRHKKLGRLIHRLLDWASNLDCECDQYDEGSTCPACRLLRTLRQTLREHVAAEKKPEPVATLEGSAEEGERCRKCIDERGRCYGCGPDEESP